MTRSALLLAALTAGCSMATPGPGGGPASGLIPVVGDDAAGLLVVDLVDGTSLEDARSATRLDLSWLDARTADESLAVVEVGDVAAAQAALASNPLVEVAEPPVRYDVTGWSLNPLRYPDDPLYPKQWNFRTVNAPRGWRVGGGEGVKVAVIDTGVSRVPDLDGIRFGRGGSFVPGVDRADDDNGHGTHVAGTIAQATDNGVGVAGLAPEVTIIPVKVLAGAGWGNSHWIAAGIDEAVDQGADVINLSLGGPASAVIVNAVQKALDAGVVVVAAAGNGGGEGVSSPASVPGVVAVSATGPEDGLAPYSSWGKGVVISAPGGDKRTAGGGILQDTITPGKKGHEYKEFQGTSMATPHVAGAMAVLLGAGATSGDDAAGLLVASATDLGTDGYDTRFGHGRLDLGKAVWALQVQRGGALFALGLVLSWMVAWLGALPRRWPMALAGAVAAGGLFFLPLLPLPPTALGALLSRPLLAWPAALVGTGWAHFPLWLSVLLPGALTFVLGPTKSLGPLVAGVACGIGVHLVYGAVTGTLSPWLLPGALGTGWLVTNGVLSVACALLVMGVQKVRRTKAA